MATETSPESLWLAWRRGEPGAFEALYDRVSPPLYALCRALTARGRIGADDLFQETFRRAVASASRFRPEGSLQGWLAVIARNAHANLLRDASRRPALGLLGAMPPDPASGDAERSVDLLDQISSLPLESREAVALHYFQGLTIPETAKLLGISLSTAKRRILEGLARLAGKT